MQLSKAAELNKRKGFEHLVKCEMVTKQRQRERQQERKKRERERVLERWHTTFEIPLKFVCLLSQNFTLTNRRTNNKQTSKQTAK